MDGATNLGLRGQMIRRVSPQIWQRRRRCFAGMPVRVSDLGSVHQGGYISPWMAPVLAQHGYVLDTSINPSWLVKRKAGKGNSWQGVEEALHQNGILSRPWKTHFSLPINGPALSLFPLSIIAKRGWKNLPTPFVADTFEQNLTSQDVKITTLYWHLLDHARKNQKWKPPLAC